MQKSGNVRARANLVTQLIHVILVSLEQKEKDLCTGVEKV